MPRKKTSVRVKRTEAWACIDDDGSIERADCWYAVSPDQDVPFEVPAIIIDRRELSEIEARLKAAEAENKRLKADRDEWRREATEYKPKR